MATSSDPTIATGHVGGNPAGGSVIGAFPIIPVLVRGGIAVARYGKNLIVGANRQLGKTFVGRVLKKVGIGAVVDEVIEETFDIHPGPFFKVAQVVKGVLTGDYSGATADAVTAFKRTRTGVKGSVWSYPDLVPRMLGRFNRDP